MSSRRKCDKRHICFLTSIYKDSKAAPRSRGGTTHLLNSGGGYRITGNQQIDFHLGFGLNRNAPTYIFGLGYSFRLDRL
jgi:Putative MetA-pathway of phenol degradation